MVTCWRKRSSLHNVNSSEVQNMFIHVAVTTLLSDLKWNPDSVSVVKAVRDCTLPTV